MFDHVLKPLMVCSLSVCQAMKMKAKVANQNSHFSLFSFLHPYQVRGDVLNNSIHSDYLRNDHTVGRGVHVLYCILDYRCPEYVRHFQKSRFLHWIVHVHTRLVLN